MPRDILFIGLTEGQYGGDILIPNLDSFIAGKR